MKAFYRPPVLFAKSLFVPVLAGGLLACSPAEPPKPETLPWHIERLPDGSTRVLGLELGRTTLLEARHILDQRADFSLFKSPDGRLSVEAFYGRFRIGPFDAVLIGEVGATEAQLQGLAERAGRPKGGPSGSWKMELTDDDIRLLQDWPIRSLTYVPRTVEYSEDFLRRQLGAPKERQTLAPGAEALFWPELGLAVVVNADEKEIFQYTAPAEFERLRQRVLTPPRPLE
ncbi:MAG: hypothetical protein PHI49_00605 [Halothiobacillaceae bacterium]|nr:hypothetical protein [Halothiobacillaceae bacterium]